MPRAALLRLVEQQLASLLRVQQLRLVSALIGSYKIVETGIHAMTDDPDGRLLELTPGATAPAGNQSPDPRNTSRAHRLSAYRALPDLPALPQPG